MPSETSDSSSESESEESGEETTGATVDLPPEVMACDPRPFNECPEGEKCGWEAADGDDRNICVGVMGEGEAGDECMSVGVSDSCDVHLLCWGIDPDSGVGVCVEFCDEANQCPDLGVCSTSNGGTLPLCLDTCDPLMPDCAPGWACFDDPNGYFFCDRDVTPDAGAHGDPCECINCCSETTLCIAGTRVDAPGCSESPGCCAVVCDFTDPLATCPGPNEVCESYYGSMTPVTGWENVGVCAVPA
jgi:hypothetical protein